MREADADRPPPPPDPLVTTPAEPWIETRAGWIFFLNALLAAPLAVALTPLAAGWILRAVGLVQGPQPLLDTIPAVARWAVPRVGWLAAPAAWFAVRGLRTVERTGPRRWLAAFLLGHLAVVAYTVAVWFGP